MAVYHVKSTGGKSSGASTADDWTDANCYAVLSTALAQSGSGDTLILDDETHTEATPPAKGGWNENKTLQSRSGDPLLCTYATSSADNYALDFNAAAGGVITINVSGISITRTVAHTGAKALIFCSGTSVDTINFTDCRIGGVTVTRTGSGSDGVLFNNVGAHSRALTFTRCKFHDVTATYADAGGILIRMSGGVGVNTPSFVYTDCEFTDWTVTHGAQSQGLIWAQIVASVTYRGCTWRNITSTSGQRNVVRHQDTATTTNVYDSTVTNVTRNDTTDAILGAWLYIAGPFDISGVYAADVRVETTGTPNGDGCLIYQSTATGIGKIRDVEVHRGKARSGAAIFCSNGASLDCENITAYDCEVAHGVIYTGGNGDADIVGVLIQNVSKPAETTASNGMGIYFRNNPLSDERDSYCNISNVTVTGCDNGSNSEGIEIQNEHATATVTATLNNIISRNTNGDDISLLKPGGTGTLDVTLNSCNYTASGFTEGNSGFGTNTENNSTTADPSLESDGSLPIGSALSAIGIRWWTGATPTGAGGEPIPNYDIDIGGIQGTDATNHPFHPLNL